MNGSSGVLPCEEMIRPGTCREAGLGRERDSAPITGALGDTGNNRLKDLE
jgi:hypothetical protein